MAETTSTVVPGEYDIDYFLGSDFGFNLNWSTEISAEEGLYEGVELQGALIEMEIRREYGARQIEIAARTSPNEQEGLIALGVSPGDFQVRIPGNFSNHIGTSLRRGVYDIKVTFPGGQVNRFLEGVIRFHPEVTKGS